MLFEVGPIKATRRDWPQANIVILPAQHALDFMRFCQRNPKSCPLVGVSETGDPIMHTLGDDVELRTDIPACNIYRHGILIESVENIRALWQQDHVAFALGCSFTFENALIGVTPQQALMRACLPLAITHKPLHMLITDVDDQAEIPLYQSASSDSQRSASDSSA